MLADIPAPLLSVYGASKSFISIFTSDLCCEYKNVRFITLAPYFVATRMSRMKQNTLIPLPENYVYSAFKMIQNGQTGNYTGYVYHTLVHNVLLGIPKMYLTDIIYSKLNFYKQTYKLRYK